MKKYNILHLIGSFRYGGAERVIFTLIRYIDKTKFIPHICYFEDGPFRRDFEKLGIPLIQIKPKGLFDLKSIISLRKYLIQNNIIILHTHLFHSDIFGRFAGCSMPNLMIFSTLHTGSTWKTRMDLKNRMKVLLDRVTYKICDVNFIATTNKVKKFHMEHIQIAASRIKILPNPLDTQLFKSIPNSDKSKIRKDMLKIPDKNKIIINVGHLTWIKGLEYLLHSFTIVKSMMNDVSLLIIGDGPEELKLKKMSKQLKIEDSVKFLGVRNDINQLLSVSEVFVISSLSEGLSIALLEAMYKKIPCVVTSVGGNVDVIQHGQNGFLVPSKDPTRMAECIINVLRNTNHNKDLIQNAYHSILSKYDASSVASQLEKIYFDALRK